MLSPRLLVKHGCWATPARQQIYGKRRVEKVKSADGFFCLLHRPFLKRCPDSGYGYVGKLRVSDFWSKKKRCPSLHPVVKLYWKPASVCRHTPPRPLLDDDENKKPIGF